MQAPVHSLVPFNSFLQQEQAALGVRPWLLGGGGGGRQEEPEELQETVSGDLVHGTLSSIY